MAKLLFVVLAVCIIAALGDHHEGHADDHKEEHRPFLFPKEVEDCRKEFNIPEDIIKNHKDIPEDKKCFHRCVSQKIGAMDANGVPQPTVFKTKLQSVNAPADMIAKLDHCFTLKKTDPCDTALEIKKCMHENHKH